MEKELLYFANQVRLKPHVSNILTLNQIVEAMELIRDRKVTGIAVLNMELQN